MTVPAPRNPDGWIYIPRKDARAKRHSIRVYRRGAPSRERKYRDFYFFTKGEALSSAPELQRQHGDWRQPVTLVTFLRKWVEEQTHHSPATIAMNTSHIELDVADFPIAAILVADLTVDHVEDWLESLKYRKKRTSQGAVLDEAISASTQRSALYFIRAALNGKSAREAGVRRPNPAAEAKGPSVQEFMPPELTDLELSRLFRVLLDDEDSALWSLLLVSGRRIGEILGIHVGDLHRSDGIIETVRSLRRGNRNTRLGQGKPHRLRAEVPEAALEQIDRYMEHKDALRLAMGERWIDTPYLFTTTVGTPRDPKAVSRRFQKLRASAGVNHVRLHDLRGYSATFASELANERTVKEYVGWSRTSRMPDHYTRVRSGRLAALGESIELQIRAMAGEAEVRTDVRNGVNDQSRRPDSDHERINLSVGDSGGASSAAVGTTDMSTVWSPVCLFVMDSIDPYRVDGAIFRFAAGCYCLPDYSVSGAVSGCRATKGRADHQCSRWNPASPHPGPRPSRRRMLRRVAGNPQAVAGRNGCVRSLVRGPRAGSNVRR